MIAIHPLERPRGIRAVYEGEISAEDLIEYRDRLCADDTLPRHQVFSTEEAALEWLAVSFDDES